MLVLNILIRDLSSRQLNLFQIILALHVCECYEDAGITLESFNLEKNLSRYTLCNIYSDYGKFLQKVRTQLLEIPFP